MFMMTKKIAQIIIIGIVLVAVFGYIIFSVFAGATIGKSLKTASLEDGLVGHWTFDGKDMISNVADVSGQGNHGSLVGQTSTTTAIGKIGQALDFDGSDDDVQLLSNPLDGVSAFSISGWVNPDSTSSGTFSLVSRWAGGGDNQILIRGGDGGVQFYTFNASAVQVGGNISTYSINTWQHFVATYDGSTMRMYKDGVVSATTYSQTGNMANTSGGPRIGGGSGSGSEYYMNGQIDDVRIYNRALSASEITQLYNQTKGNVVNKTVKPSGLQDGLVGHWTFDGPDMLSNVADVSGQGNHGYLNGQISTTTDDGKIGQALDFDGVDDWVKIPNDDSLNFNDVSFSLGGWFNSTEGGVLMYKYNSGQAYYLLSMNTDKTFRIRVNDGDQVILDSDSTYSFNEWHHIMSVINQTNNTMYIYIDGVLDGSADISLIGNLSNSGYLRILSNYNDTVHIEAKVDDVRIYNRALLADEINQLYQLGR